ncbi:MULTISPECIES: N-glycosylase/DNA lyase [Pseudothermotoga]|uniref:8-oxoguanine DNA glycosylase/AP lyase n=1 Tax=Pseudothermotoga lettingae (strain ATCC BAA-301 / DSM 14385 / NBRC 107922 / TMO) TaxID=416591 RepID=A8F598_PSELT|nr:MULTISPECIES: N-glycosylase/DNA lyase [Pseudothermotoga]ABV33332.1 DNA-(apurinic or apyrimidinic site) lyase [Pseudothermotoga lettingae TMO]HBJ80746.1 DNA lyase [Pseudothermotoga sp.]HBT25867.1 DNA lyase [Pseudothermotoga sp.]
MTVSLSDELLKIREEAKDLVEERFRQFKNLGLNGTEEELFSELSFCVLTANWTAQGGIKAQKLIGKAGFIHLDEDELSKKLSELGHRFPKARASYIIKNRKIIGQLKQLTTIDPFEAREWLVNNAIGIGYKEASHFLRNTGVEKLAILDRHVLSLMHRYNIIEEIPKTLTKKRYLIFERLLSFEAEKFGESPGKFDLYLWFFVKKKVEK